MPLSKSVSGGRNFNPDDILPNSVSFPVLTTKTDAFPLMTCEPINSALLLLASGVSVGRIPAFFSTGKVSPVKAASSTNNSLDSKIKLSPGITSPADKTTTSPGTTSSTVISFFCPSRKTSQWSCTIFSNSFTASAAPFSCQKPRKLLINTMVKMMMVSATSPKTADNKAAIISNKVIGLLNCDKNNRKAEPCELALMVFEPYAFNLFSASSLLSPFGSEVSWLNVSSLLKCQKLLYGSGLVVIFQEAIISQYKSVTNASFTLSKLKHPFIVIMIKSAQQTLILC